MPSKRKPKVERPAVSTERRDAYLQRTYGITQAEYDKIWLAQGNACASCRRKPYPGRYTSFFAVDHDHKIKEKRKSVRAIVCNWCNRIMGLLDRFQISGTALDKIRNTKPAQEVLNGDLQ